MGSFLAVPILETLGEDSPARNARAVSSAVLAGLLFFGVLAVRPRPLAVWTAAGLAYLVVALRLWGSFSQDGTLRGPYSAVDVVFVGFVIFHVIMYLLTVARVTTNVLAAPRCGLMLLSVTGRSDLASGDHRPVNGTTVGTVSQSYCLNLEFDLVADPATAERVTGSLLVGPEPDLGMTLESRSSIGPVPADFIGRTSAGRRVITFIEGRAIARGRTPPSDHPIPLAIHS